MKSLIIALSACVALSAIAASHATRSYTKKNGTHVQRSHATNPNHKKSDNYSQKGNVNPYTGKNGTK